MQLGVTLCQFPEYPRAPANRLRKHVSLRHLLDEHAFVSPCVLHVVVQINCCNVTTQSMVTCREGVRDGFSQIAIVFGVEETTVL